MKLLALHPSGLMYTRVFLTLEPLGLELVAAAARASGHDVHIVDLQVEQPETLWRLIEHWRPDAVCMGGNYLADLTRAAELSQHKDGRILHWLAAAQRDAGRLAEALATQQAASRQRPHDPDIQEQLKQFRDLPLDGEHLSERLRKGSRRPD